MSRRHFLKLAPLAGALVAGMGLLYRAPARADAPNLINYQGRLTDASGSPLTGSYPMNFKLYSVPTGGTALWTESWSGANAVSVTDGQFNVLLGSLTSLPSPLPSGDLYLGVAVSSDPEMTPRERLVSVPYALQVPDGSIGTAKLTDGAVTSRKLSAMSLFAEVNSNEQTTSTSFTDLATPGPSVTFNLDVAQKVHVFWCGTAQNTVVAENAQAGIMIDGVEADVDNTANVNGQAYTTVCAFKQVSLGPGSHTIKLRYKVSAGMGSWLRRKLLVSVVGQ